MTVNGPRVVGVDVGGTNTDAVLLDTSRDGTSAVLASHKEPTTSNVTLSIQAALKALLGKSSTTVDPADIAALAVGTTHFLNAIIERDTSRVEKVAVIRLASYDFSTSTPPFMDWPSSLRRIIHGHSVIVPGGVNIDGKALAPVDEDAVRRAAADIMAKGLMNVVIVGIGAPNDENHHQEEHVEEILRETFAKEGRASINIVRSRSIAGSGLLARENAAILNASILNFARRTIRSFTTAMRRIGLRCTLYFTSNAGHLLPFSEAVCLPIRIFSSGATNSIRGAAFLAGSRIGPNGCVVVDIGGTTTDVGFLLKNGYPRLSRTYASLAGVKVNLEMPSVESVGLGGGSIVHVGDDGQVRVGPDSVGHDIITRAVCFGGNTVTATDVAVASGADIGKVVPVSLEANVVAKAEERMKRMLEIYIDRAKLSPEPCTVILVGGGSILCPPELNGVGEIIFPEHGGVANAIGAAMSKIYGSADLLVDVADVDIGRAKTKEKAIANSQGKGGIAESVTVLNEEVAWVPYAEGQRMVKVEVALEADHARVYEEMLKSGHAQLDDSAEESLDDLYEETKQHDVAADDQTLEEEAVVVDLDSYRPDVDAEGRWHVSVTDLKFIEIGCYILGCGGGGSPYGAFLTLRQFLQDGERITITRTEDLEADDIICPVAGIGTPAVGLERPGGAGVLHAMQAMSKLLGVKFSKVLSTEIGGSNGLGALIWGSSRYYNVPVVDGDFMGRAYPNFEMVSRYITAKSVNELLPVTLCSGIGDTVVIPANQEDETSAGKEIRRVCASMGFAAGAAGKPLSGPKMQVDGIPNTFSLSWRLGRVVAKAQRTASLANVADALIDEAGGSGSARRIFQGKIRGVASTITATAHSLGEVAVERLGEDEMETDADKAEAWTEVTIPFMNENLAVIATNREGEKKVLATVPDLIFLLDTSTGEAIGTQEYRYGLKVTVMIMAPHPIWTTKRGLEIAGPAAFHLPYEYTSPLKYTKPRSVIDEFRGQ